MVDVGGFEPRLRCSDCRSLLDEPDDVPSEKTVSPCRDSWERVLSRLIGILRVERKPRRFCKRPITEVLGPGRELSARVNEEMPAAQFLDGVTFVLPPGSVAGVTSARAKPGDTIVFYGVGFGTVSPDSPAGQIVTQSNRLSGNFQAFFGGTPATVSFSGLTGGYLGLYQFNVMVPNIAASDTVPVTFSLDGTPGTQTLLIAIQN